MLPDRENTIRMMMYIFPRQFGLHNAFTSRVDPFTTAHKFLDYTLREDEIFSKFPRRLCQDDEGESEDAEGEKNRQRLDVRIPKRLRGAPEHLVRRLQTLHARCSYVELLQYHCPVDATYGGSGSDGKVASAQASSNYHSSTGKTPPLTNKPPGKSVRGRRKPRPAQASTAASSASSLLDLALPISNVSAYCRAVLWKVIPRQFWGTGDVQTHNLAVIRRNIDRFIRLRRFETFSLHEAMQGLRVCYLVVLFFFPFVISSRD